MNNSNSLYKQVQDMKVGDIITVPIGRYSYNTARRYASDFGIALDRCYSCHIDRVSRIYIITRKS